MHGADGMGDLGLPALRPAGPPTCDAVDPAAPRDPRLRRRPVTLVPTAPLTNIALLLRTHPEVAAQHRADRVHGRRGGHRQRHAGRRVQRLARPGGGRDRCSTRRACRSRCTAWTCSQRVLVPAPTCTRLRASSGARARLAGELLAHRTRPTRATPRRPGGLGDAGAVCCGGRPGGPDHRACCPVEVSLAPGPARGQTVVDRRPRPGESEIHEGVREQTLVDVALDVDVERYVKLWLTTVEIPGA